MRYFFLERFEVLVRSILSLLHFLQEQLDLLLVCVQVSASIVDLAKDAVLGKLFRIIRIFPPFLISILSNI